MYGSDRTVIEHLHCLWVMLEKNTVWNEIIHESELRCNGDLGVREAKSGRLVENTKWNKPAGWSLLCIDH